MNLQDQGFLREPSEQVTGVCMEIVRVIKNFRDIMRAGVVMLTVAVLMNSSPLAAQPSMNDYTAVPPLSLLSRGNPMILLTLSADHQLFFKAYNDYDDLNGDGRPDITYEPSFDYLGYFDHQKCYLYDSATERFDISATAPNDADLQYCAGAQWSGNFLNWLTMTRMDLVRLVLYGGYRVTDTTTLTVLERAWLPHDAHSFAKYYNGADVNQLMDPDVLAGRTSCDSSDPACTGYTFCNTSRPTGIGVLSQEAAARNQPPLLRIVKGNYQFWSNSERFQCLYGPTHDSPGSELAVIGTDQEGDNGNDVAITGVNAFPTSPAAAQGRDLLVRVVACGANSEGGTHSCKTYGTGRKPVGVLQEYGENLAAPVKFGLLTGGYNTNKTFGNLRKNIGAMADEIDPETGVFRRESTLDSIVNNLDALRIVDYLYKDSGGENTLHGTYRRANPTNGMICDWAMNSNSFLDGNCRNWGNPFSELLAESYRYYAGARGANGIGDDGLLPGLTVATWRDPLAADERKECVDMNVIGFNASTVSYDGELFSQKLSDLGLPVNDEDATVATLVQRIGQRELDPGAQYFVGQTSGVSNGLCTPKTVSNLAEVRGTCPEAPGLAGGYAGAGLAHYAYTNDMRPELAGKNTVRTFGVTLAGNLPQITVRVPGTTGREITILPACRNSSIGGNGNCAIVDFKPLEVTDTTGSYLVSWEDSEQGGDFDVDLNGVIRYTISGTSITVETRITYVSTPESMGFGFVISGTGTTADNFYILSAVNGFSAPGFGCGASCTASQWNQQTFAIEAAGANATAQFLKSPLYYAAKWGSFTDLTTSPASQTGVPDDAREWDQNGDGQPDGYFLVSNPAQLKTQLENTINGILYRVSAGTGASLSVSNTSGDGLFLQSLYRGEVNDGARKVNWVGALNGLFLDRFGYLREDTDGNGRLSAADRIIEIFYDRDEGDTFVNRFDVGTDGQPLINENTRRGLGLDAITPVWSARDQLGSLSTAQLLAQRSPYLGGSRGRYLFTGVDTGGATPADGQVVATEVVPFTAASLSGRADLAALLDTGSAESAQQVLRFIRGEEGIEGFRSRSINLDNDTALESWLLGDIMHSTAAIVGKPNGRYDLNYGDDSYRAYRDHYAGRRQVVYVGANDGMLHAFNAGFFNPDTTAYSTAPNGATGGLPLGDELWGYVPYNLLPHLKWLTRADYNHVYYVDSNVQVYDVNIFDEDEDHPHGWGTIVVAGMRFGGGDYPVNVGGNDARTLRSAYVIMDVTNPEKPPQLLAEVTDAALGYTLGLPDLVKFRRPASNGSFRGEVVQNDWHLVFGSGPRGGAALSTATSDQPAQLFSLDLVNLVRRGSAQLIGFALDEPHAFVGSLRSVDWNRDYLDDGLYFGIVGDGIARDDEKTRGGLKQVTLRPTGSNIFDSASDLLDPADFDLPFTVRPLAINDTQGNYWIFAGSGRFLSASDLATTGDHYYFGIKVNAGTGLSDQPVAADELFESSAHKVYLAADGSTLVENDAGARIGSVEDANAQVDELAGWYREFRPGESSFSLPAFLAGTLVVNGYTPPDGAGCQAEGTTRQYVLDMFNGMAQTQLQTVFYDGSTVNRDNQEYRGLDEVANVIDGLASDNVVVNGKVGVLTEYGNPVQLEIKPSPPKAYRRSWREVPLDEVDL